MGIFQPAMLDYPSVSSLFARVARYPAWCWVPKLNDEVCLARDGHVIANEFLGSLRDLMFPYAPYMGHIYLHLCHIFKPNCR